jgi:hypothetical protein
LPQLIGRPNGWHSQARAKALWLPPGKYRVEAFRGIETELAAAEFEIVPGAAPLEIKLPLVPLETESDWAEGNTHLHLGDTSPERAKEYLKAVGATDGLDFVWVSHLTRTGAEYASNALDRAAAQALTTERTQFGWGQEHRHNFPPNLNGYGHTLLLDIPELIEPVSLGRVLSRAETDGVPLRPGMEQARAMGGTVLWAHNNAGYEDIPSWLSGALDVQNVWDGGSALGLEESLYRYLDIGLNVPLSSGTDWWVRSLSRVRVHLTGPRTRETFLAGLRAGRTTVSTGPLLGFEVDGAMPGERVSLPVAGSVRVQAVALGRVGFETLELLQDGRIIASVEAEPVGAHWEAHLDRPVEIGRSGWLAIRVPEARQLTEFAGPLLAHSSAVAVEVAGEPRFEPQTARSLILEMDWNRREIRRRATFADDAERETVEDIYRESVDSLEARLPFFDRLGSMLTRWLRTVRDWLGALF